jgi:hypothetical protein
MKDSEPVRVLNSDKCSVRLVAGDSEPVSVLNSEICSPTLEAALNEPVNVLKIEECSARTVERPMESERLLVKPFI